MQRTSKLLTLAFALSSFMGARAGTFPPNDECASATTIAVVAPGACGAVQGDNGDATVSGPTPSCDATSLGTQDVWYTFNSGIATTVDITLTPGVGMSDHALAVYAGCAGSEVACAVTPLGPVTIATTPNTTYVIQVYSNLDFGIGGLFTLCVEGTTGGGGGGNPPPNDECSGAVQLTVGTSCVPTSGTLADATESTQIVYCSGVADDDVWYTFTPLATNDHNMIATSGNQTDLVVEVYSGTCGNLQLEGCVDNTNTGQPESAVFPGFIGGQTYRLRVFDSTGGPTPTPSLTICVWGPAPPPLPPANDDCSGTVPLNMTATCVPTSGTSFGATYSGNSNNFCGAVNGQEDDVWYSFTATSGDVQITVDGNGTGSTGFDPVVELYYADNCGASFNQLACANNTGAGGTEQLSFQGVGIGTTYYVLVYDAGQDAPGTSTFTICVQDVSPSAGIADGALSDADWSVQLTDERLVLRTDRSAAGSWSLLDAAGRTVRSGAVQGRTGFVHEVQLSDLAPGMYAVRLELGGAVGVKRFVRP